MFPPSGTGRRVYPEEIENRMRLLRVPKVSARVLREAAEAATGEAAPLVEWPEGEALSSSVTVRVSEDGMAAWVKVEPPKKGGAPLQMEDVEEELALQGIVHGLDLPAVERILTRGEFDREVLVARGTPPVHGQGRRVAYLFNINRGKPYLEMDFGRIDLRELNFIDNKHKDDLLASLLPPTKAVDGKTVTGHLAPASPGGEGAKLLAGENTVLSPDGTRIFAARDGNAKLVGQQVVIEPVVTVENVNYETGNIRFEGTVVIRGGIADGFTVEAAGDIQVGKSVGRAFLKAGGSILLKTGINGSGEARLECGEDLYARYIENTRVVCRGNLFVEEAIMHSQITVWKNCLLSGRRSEVIAGSALVGGSFWCKKLGSVYETPTYVAVGTAPNLLTAYREAQKSLDAKMEELDKVEKSLDQFEKAVLEGRGGDKVEAARNQLRASANRLGVEVAGLRREIPRLRERLEPARKSILVAEDMIFPGVTILFGNREFRVPDTGSRKTVLRPGAGGIVESGFSYHHRPRIFFGEGEKNE